jgi:chaperonin GroES
LKGDALASGAKKQTFCMAGESKDAPIELKNVAPEEPNDIVSHVDNSASFAKKAEQRKPTIWYEGSPLSDMVLVKRVERDSNSLIVLPDSAKGKSDTGVVVSVGPGVIDRYTGERTQLCIQPGELILFDKFAAVGMEISLIDADGDEAEHLILREHDILLRLQAVQRVESSVQ